MADKSRGDDLAAEKSKYDERLDFFSPKFDPLLALNTPNLKPPDHSARTHDNLWKYNSIHNLKIQIGSSSKQTSKQLEKDSSQPVRKFTAEQMPIRNQYVRVFKNVLTRMNEAHGPSELFKKCKQENIKIKIVTRHSHGIRGYCIAYLTAFDKFWNLSLRDVKEVWTRRKKTKVPVIGEKCLEGKEMEDARMFFPKIKIIKSDKKTETCERNLKQLLLRGEQIVLVSVHQECSGIS